MTLRIEDYALIGDMKIDNPEPWLSEKNRVAEPIILGDDLMRS